MNLFRLTENQGGNRQIQSSNGETKWIKHENRKTNASSSKIWPSVQIIVADPRQLLGIHGNLARSGECLLPYLSTRSLSPFFL